MPATALVLLHPGFEELEATAAIDLLVRAGVRTTLASLEGTLEVTGKNGIRFLADLPLDQVIDDPFDLIVLPGGPGIAGVREDGRCAKRMVRQLDAGSWVGCICAAPLVLKDAGIIPGIRYTAHASTADELTERSEDAVVIDGKVITSTGAGTATPFALALVTALVGEASAAAIADSIAWRSCE